MKPFSGEWLLGEWENLSWKEVLLQFYYSDMKGKLYIQGMYAAMLFFTFNFTLLFIRDREEVLLTVQLKADILFNESVWLDFCGVWWPRLPMRVQNPMLGLKSTLSRYLKAPTPSEGIFLQKFWLTITNILLIIFRKNRSSRQTGWICRKRPSPYQVLLKKESTKQPKKDRQSWSGSRTTT